MAAHKKSYALRTPGCKASVAVLLYQRAFYEAPVREMPHDVDDALRINKNNGVHICFAASLEDNVALWSVAKRVAGWGP